MTTEQKTFLMYNSTGFLSYIKEMKEMQTQGTVDSGICKFLSLIKIGSRLFHSIIVMISS